MIRTWQGLEKGAEDAVPAFVKRSIEQLEPGLTIIDGDREQTVASARIDITTGSQQTLRWRSESRANPSLTLVLIPGRLWVIPDRKSDVSCLE